MRRLVRWVLDGLPFDPRSRRALDETLIDWAREADAAASTMGRGLAHGHGFFGILRAVAGCSFNEIGRVPIGWLAARVALFGLPMVLLLMVLPTIYMGKSLGYLRAAGVVVWGIPELAVVVSAPVLLLAVAWRADGRRIPAVGAALTAAVAMVVLIGWVLPWSHQIMGERQALAMSEVHGTPRLDRLPSEPTLPDLFGQLAGPGPQRERALVGLARIAGYSALAGATVLFAGSLSRRVSLRGLSLILAIPAAYVAAAVTGFVVVGPLLRGPFLSVALIWISVVLTVAMTIFANRRIGIDTQLEGVR